ncbi:MAG: response regulator [bacterium]
MDPENKPNILIVDDIEANVSFMERIIRPLNVNMILAYSGEEALGKIRNTELALALIDVQMPEMDGLELAAHILGDRTRDMVPIIFVTAYAYDELHLEKFYKSGIIDFLVKPFQRSILTGKIRILLELYRQKQRILESEKMYRMLLNASPEGIVILDVRGRITELSSITSEIFGILNKVDFIGQHVRILFPKDEQSKLDGLLEKTLRGGMIRNVEFLLTRADQSQFISEISTTLISDRRGKPQSYMAVIRDISPRKLMEQKLIHAERLAGLGEMATGIAHEINQPLNTISLGIENLLEEIRKYEKIDQDYFQKKAKKIFDNITRISYIIDHVRTFSRGQDDFILTNFMINESIRNGLSLISEQFRHKGIGLTLELDNSVPPILGNPYKFEQVIMNVLVNAKDALEEKKKKTRKDFGMMISITSRHEQGMIVVEVTDNGIGIRAEEIQGIMLPFHTTKEPGKGTGLGLSISYGIIKEMHGDIEVKSQLSTGTTIRITIPAETEKGKTQ